MRDNFLKAVAQIKGGAPPTVLSEFAEQYPIARIMLHAPEDAREEAWNTAAPSYEPPCHCGMNSQNRARFSTVKTNGTCYPR